jgi:hypothetical protein
MVVLQTTLNGPDVQQVASNFADVAPHEEPTETVQNADWNQDWSNA